jgi:ABC-2 type transport system ATP-binding protein
MSVQEGAAVAPMISISAVTKTYASGLVALHPVDLAIARGEIFALLGPNGAGKTTLISIICGTVAMSSGKVAVDGHDIISDYRATRKMVGLVPQEIALDIFNTVWNTVRFSRGLFGRGADDRYLERLLNDLSLWERRNSRIVELSGGMKRRVMIAKALSHEPDVLFLDEPTAGVDVNLRRDMWALVRQLREKGVTIILTTHYIEEAEEMADRVGVIDQGRLLLVDEKAALMRKLGKRRLTFTLSKPMPALPPELAEWSLALDAAGRHLTYSFDANAEDTGIPKLLRRLGELGVDFKDLDTEKSSLEDIFVRLVGHAA